MNIKEEIEILKSDAKWNGNEKVLKVVLAELEKKDKIIDELVKYIVNDIKNAIIVKDICINNAKELCFTDDSVDCKKCIREYFEREVEK